MARGFLFQWWLVCCGLLGEITAVTNAPKDTTNLMVGFFFFFVLGFGKAPSSHAFFGFNVYGFCSLRGREWRVADCVRMTAPTIATSLQRPVTRKGKQPVKSLFCKHPRCVLRFSHVSCQVLHYCDCCFSDMFRCMHTDPDESSVLQCMFNNRTSF